MVTILPRRSYFVLIDPHAESGIFNSKNGTSAKGLPRYTDMYLDLSDVEFRVSSSSEYFFNNTKHYDCIFCRCSGE